MRADRLLALLMLLQARGPITAARLAEELEVTERTIYRDVQALSTSGVPVYAERGPGGGISLVDSYRTTLTGLKSDEVRALFMLSIPAPLDQLGVGSELRAALLKLSAALPAARRSDETLVRQRIHLDWTPWAQGPAPGAAQDSASLPHLPTIQQALWASRKLALRYRSPTVPWIEPLDVVVDPYGLVAKAGEWHLVCARQGSLRAIPVAQVLSAQLLEQTFARRADFDLPAFWSTFCQDVQARRTVFPVTLRLAPQILPELRYYFGSLADEHWQAAAPDASGWRTLTLPFRSLESARRHILAYGGAVEVLTPPALRLSLQDYAQQILNIYR